MQECAKALRMYKIIRESKFRHPNLDLEIVEVIKLDDARYKNGIMYTFRYMRYLGENQKYETAFAVENSHGQPHVHKGEEEYEVDYDWKRAFLEFESMVDEYRMQNRLDNVITW